MSIRRDERMKSGHTKPNWIHLEHGLFLSHCMHVSEAEDGIADGWG